MCDGLLFCHRGCGIGPAAVLLHRDIKPPNVLLRRDRTSGRLVGVLGDFGISKLYPEGLAAAATTLVGALGTPGYVAPEISEGDSPSTLSDAYAVGITILQVGACVTCVQ
jgi:serine/threonine protein kinase